MGEIRDWERLGGDATPLDDLIAKQAPTLTPWQRQEACTKFAGFLVPREQQHDPPINLSSELVPYYPLYGMLAHWFLPGVKVAMSLLQDRWVPTKPAALPALGQALGETPLLHRIQGILDQSYLVEVSSHELQQLAAELLRILRGLHVYVEATCRSRMLSAPVDESVPMLRMGLQALGGIRGRLGIMHFFRRAPPSFDGAWLRVHLLEEIEYLTRNLLRALAWARGMSSDPAPTMSTFLTGTEMRVVNAVLSIAAQREEVTDMRLDTLMSEWPPFAVLAEEVYALEIAPRWQAV